MNDTPKTDALLEGIKENPPAGNYTALEKSIGFVSCAFGAFTPIGARKCASQGRNIPRQRTEARQQKGTTMKHALLKPRRVPNFEANHIQAALRQHSETVAERKIVEIEKRIKKLYWLASAAVVVAAAVGVIIGRAI